LYERPPTLASRVIDGVAGGPHHEAMHDAIQTVLADEINRATPKAQSALLEAMEERQVTVEGETRPLPEPFFVIATQNPIDQVGTFRLPESQLDRFLMRIRLDYPAEAAERALLLGSDRRELIERLPPRLDAEAVCRLQAEAAEVHVSPALADYLLALLAESRSGHYRHGLSPRAGLALRNAARAWAWIDGRDHVLPDDVRAVLPAVAGHRLTPVEDMRDEPLAPLLAVAIP